MIPYPWLKPAAAALSRQRATLPNAMLLYGPRGAGGFELAYEFAKSLLCHHPGPEGEPCGHCRGCELTRAGTHPDLRVIVPEYFAVAKDLPFAQPESSSSTRKTLSREILLPQVKALGDFLELTANQGGRRIVVIYPAEMVRAEAAAALLKSIEEPPSECTFLLVTEELDAVLPTIRSRSRLFRRRRLAPFGARRCLGSDAPRRGRKGAPQPSASGRGAHARRHRARRHEGAHGAGGPLLLHALGDGPRSREVGTRAAFLPA